MNNKLQGEFLLILFLLCASASHALEITVPTPSGENPRVVFQCRVPKGYAAGRQCNVLVYFGGRNTDGRAEASGSLGWGEWCDANGVFILAPGFREITCTFCEKHLLISRH